MNQIEKQKWLDAGGPDLQHTVEDSGPDSVVFDIGLYRGSWASIIMQKYNPVIYGFEPVKDFYESAQRVLAKCPKVSLFNYGLGNKTHDAFIYVDNDSSSFIKESGHAQVVNIKSIKDVLIELDIESVDLASINIEGAEYELLTYLLDTGLIKKFKQLLIQFHDIGVCPEAKRRDIRDDLALTHEKIYSYDTVWDYWKLLKGVTI